VIRWGTGGQLYEWIYGRRPAPGPRDAWDRLRRWLEADSDVLLEVWDRGEPRFVGYFAGLAEKPWRSPEGPVVLVRHDQGISRVPVKYCRVLWPWHLADPEEVV